ncbi:phospholipase D family protein [Aliivibrio fischeri]|uniref:phospholipase D family protein n=1 Tax=Aliivibrio fischeri TaxID=668 RepID=UPI0007C57ACA|nr:phospholipase D family protein [Aliivibrio fischeri]
MINRNLLLSEELIINLKNAFDVANNVIILSAYVTKPAVELLLKHTPLGVDIQFICRARPDDILSGSCDLNALKILHYSGVKCFISRELHAKLYVIDKSIAFVGSANFTHSGLKIAGYGNIELSVQIELTSSDLELICQIRNNAIKITSDILKKLEYYVEHFKHEQPLEVDEWWDNILNVSDNYNISDGLYIIDLPWCNLKSTYNTDEAVAHDGDIFKLGNANKTIRSFKMSKIYQFFQKKMTEEGLTEVYYGQVVKWIHSALKDDTVPYRSQVKDYVTNFYSYIEQYGQEHFIVDRPNFSQRIKLV